MEILKVKNLSFSYFTGEDGQNKKIISNVSFSLSRGDFLIITGGTGSGKTTLLRLLKRELSPRGKTEGEIEIFGQKADTLSDHDAAKRIGFVAQYPEEGIVTDKVWHELAFGLENLGAENGVIRRKIAEMAAYFGIEHIFDSDTDTLSGGQKQLISLASVMAMDPDILILDEPTSRLDPITASDFLATVHKLNRDLGLTVIMVEHRLEEVVSYATKLLSLDNKGEVAVFGETRDAVKSLLAKKEVPLSLPVASRLHFAHGGDYPIPLTVSEGRAYIENGFKNHIRSLPTAKGSAKRSPALTFKNVFFRYERNGGDILKNFSLTAYEGECLTVLGGNGSGKSTFLKLASGLTKPYSGSVSLFGKKLSAYKNGSLYNGNVSLLPQDVKTCFLHDTVKAELDSVNFDPESFPLDLSELYDSHPYDLSGGQMQLVALAKALSTNPRLLLLDEPTKGLDASAKSVFADVIKKLTEKGVTVIAVTHDTDLAADISDRIAMVFRGEITSVGTPKEFFSNNSFFTTAVSRMTRGHYDSIISYEDALLIMEKNGRR